MGHLSTVSLNGSGSGAVSSVTAGNGISVNSGDPANPIVSVNKIYGSSGVLTGGVLSTGAGATQYSISDGTGVIVNTSGTITSVSWSGKSNITPTNIASTLLTWVAINSSGNVVEKSTPFTASEIRANIFLGVVVHVDKATVDGVNNEQLVAYQPLSSVFDLADVIGFMNASGNVFSANGANLQINKSAGEMYAFGSNYPTDSTNPHVSSLGALAPVTFQYRFSNGTNGVTGTSIDPNNLDNLSGGLTAVGTNKWSVQRIYSFVSNNVKIQRGQADYISSEVAIDSILFSSYQTEASIAANGLLRGWLVVKQGATDLSNTAQAIFLAAPKFGDAASGASSSGALSASTLQVSYNNSAEPEILTDSTRGAVTIKRGSAADTDTIIEGLNGAGSITFSVTGEGVVTGTLTNCTGLPVSTGISGFGTNVATALAVNVGSAGAFVTFNGAGGTPSSLTLTNATGYADDVTLAENKAIKLDPVLSADGKYTGTTISGTAGAALAFGELCYLAAADSRWELADADAASTSGDVLLGFCVLAAAADGDPTVMLLSGNIRADTAFPALTISAPVYAGTTPGAIQVAQPSGTDDVIRRVGFALTADSIVVAISPDYITAT